MTNWFTRAIICFIVWLVGTVIGLATGAAGICGNGGWGLIPAVIGLLAFPAMCVCLILGGIQSHRKRKSEA